MEAWQVTEWEPLSKMPSCLKGESIIYLETMDNYANNPDDSEQESADTHPVMSPFPASGSLLEEEGRTAAGRQDQRPGNIPHFPVILTSP